MDWRGGRERGEISDRINWSYFSDGISMKCGTAQKKGYGLWNEAVWIFNLSSDSAGM